MNPLTLFIHYNTDIRQNVYTNLSFFIENLQIGQKKRRSNKRTALLKIYLNFFRMCS